MSSLRKSLKRKKRRGLAELERRAELEKKLMTAKDGKRIVPGTAYAFGPRYIRAERIWTRYKTLGEFLESPLYAQLTGLMEVYDENMHTPILAKTFPKLVLDLNELTENPSAEVIGKSPIPLPPSDRLIGHLMKPLLEEMGLGLKDFRSWETMLRTPGKAQPSDWDSILGNEYKQLVGVDERRFLQTRNKFPTVDTLGFDHFYHPFGVVNIKERSELSSGMPFDEYWAKSEMTGWNPSTWATIGAKKEVPLTELQVLVDGDFWGAKDFIVKRRQRRV